MITFSSDSSRFSAFATLFRMDAYESPFMDGVSSVRVNASVKQPVASTHMKAVLAKLEATRKVFACERIVNHVPPGHLRDRLVETSVKAAYVHYLRMRELKAL